MGHEVRGREERSQKGFNEASASVRVVECKKKERDVEAGRGHILVQEGERSLSVFGRKDQEYKSGLDGRESGSQGDPCPIQNESYRILSNLLLNRGQKVALSHLVIEPYFRYEYFL